MPATIQMTHYPILIRTPSAAKSHDADALLHPPHQCLFKEDRKSRLRGRAAFDVLQFRASAPNTQSQPRDGRWCDGSPLEMVDVVDVLDAFEAKRQRQPKVIFDVERWRIGEGYYVTVTMPNSEPEKISDTFATEAEAWAGSKMDRLAART